MENLTEEQTIELNEILKLPKEEQQEKLNELLKKLTPEQIESLKSKQCPFCLIAENKIESKKIYEDSFVIATLDINPANLGHIILFPKLHYLTSFQVPEEEVKHIFNIANLISKKITEIVKADGINLFVANGEVAGQKISHFVIHIIPRFKEDNINLTWQPKKIEEEDLNKIVQSFSDFKIQKQEKKKEKIKFREEERIP